ncbi:transglutaminase-like domain-containing protein [Deinococcus radiophilus]|uniref:transglutaminase-like domain-containing protein n=1 Tax=Deinococcus radiophilus TaxID=32062 RepID=UPI00361E9CC1
MVTRPSGRATRYTLTSAPSRVGIDERQERLDFNLNLPAQGGSPRARALAEGWRTLAPEQRVQAALELFASGGFSYTLSPPRLPEQDRTDAFLFSAQAGFCEHYASAFGFLMRAAGVPTRLVGGYQGGEMAAGSQTVTVRQSFAHVWNEVWLEGQGWVRVDPTAAVAPARTQTDPQTALRNPNATASAPRQGLWARLTGAYDDAQLQWYDLVVNFDDQTQAGALGGLGFGEVGAAATGWLLVDWAYWRCCRCSGPGSAAAVPVNLPPAPWMT